MNTYTVSEALEPAERAAFFAEMRRLRRRRAALVAALRAAEGALDQYADAHGNVAARAIARYARRTLRGEVRS